MLCFGGSGISKKKRTVKDLKQYTLSFKVNIATYDVKEINRERLKEWMENQLEYGHWDMMWDDPVLE